MRRFNGVLLYSSLGRCPFSYIFKGGLGLVGKRGWRAFQAEGAAGVNVLRGEEPGIVQRMSNGQGGPGSTQGAPPCGAKEDSKTQGPASLPFPQQGRIHPG